MYIYIGKVFKVSQTTEMYYNINMTTSIGSERQCKVHLFCLINIYNIYIQMHAFAQASHNYTLGSVGTMAAWWNEGKYVVVNDRTPQSLMNSSSLIWVDPQRALTGPDLLTPAPGAELTPVVQKGDVFAEINVHRRKVASLLIHRRGYESCSMCRRYIPCSNTVNCIWCKCFPNQACCLEQTCFLD